MYLRPPSKNKRQCKICGEKGYIDSFIPLFKCPVCGWIEDSKQEENHELKVGRNSKTFNEAKQEYEINWNKYGILINKKVKITMNDGKVEEYMCRDYRCNSLLCNGHWICTIDIKSVKIIE